MAGLGFVICPRERLARMQHVPGRSYYLSMADSTASSRRAGRCSSRRRSRSSTRWSKRSASSSRKVAPTARHARYVRNFEALDSGMIELGFRRLLPEAILSRISLRTWSPTIPSYSFDAMHDRLYAQGLHDLSGQGGSAEHLPAREHGRGRPPRHARVRHGDARHVARAGCFPALLELVRTPRSRSAFDEHATNATNHGGHDGHGHEARHDDGGSRCDRAEHASADKADRQFFAENGSKFEPLLIKTLCEPLLPHIPRGFTPTPSRSPRTRWPG